MMKSALLLVCCVAVASAWWKPTPRPVRPGGSSAKLERGMDADCLSRHNNYRSRHVDTPALQLDAQLSASAQKYALKLANTDRFEHSNGNYGENLWMGGGYPVSGACQQASDGWYSEISKYDFSNPGYKSGVGHFTQMVWKDTTKVGFGIATKGRKVYVVAQYLKRGNFMRRFAANVKPPKSY